MGEGVSLQSRRVLLKQFAPQYRKASFAKKRAAGCLCEAKKSTFDGMYNPIVSLLVVLKGNCTMLA